MINRTANLLGAVGLAVADRIQNTASNILSHSGETPAAVVVIGYGRGPSNDQLRRALRLSHPGTVRLVDRLVADGLVKRRRGKDKRAIALHLTKKGALLREQILKGRLEAVRPLIVVLSKDERIMLDELLCKLLISMNPSDEERRTLCRLCDNRVCTNCPIPASFRDD